MKTRSRTEYHKQWRLKNLDKEKERLKKYYLKRKRDPKFIARRKRNRKKWTLLNLKKCAEYSRKWREEHPGYTKALYLKFLDKNRKRVRDYNRKHLKEKRIYNSIYLINNPDKKNFYRRLGAINKRCNYKNHDSFNRYGGRGIKNLLTLKDLEFLWNRDRAWELKKASIDRINNDGHYELNNCRFIEMTENSKKQKEDRMKGGLNGLD